MRLHLGFSCTLFNFHKLDGVISWLCNGNRVKCLNYCLMLKVLNYFWIVVDGFETVN